MRRVLISGAGSYVGTAVRERLEQDSCEYLVDEIDVRGQSWRSASFEQYDSVYHVAGIAHASSNRSNMSMYMSVNCDLAIEVGRKAKTEGVGQFVFMSSALVYGDSVHPREAEPITLDTPPAPNGLYGRSKLLAEEGLLALRDQSFEVAVLRCPMIYGPRCSKGNFPKLVSIAHKTPAFPDYDNKRSMLYLGNLVELVKQLIDLQVGGVFLPQNSEYIRTAELVSLLGNAQKHQVRLTKTLNPIIDAMLLSGNNAVKKAFGSFYYAQECSSFDIQYQLYSLEESIFEIAQKNEWV